MIEATNRRGIEESGQSTVKQSFRAHDPKSITVTNSGWG
ncbi:hypothetical protein PVAP13_5KG205000 [Panicum virgatum]|uniref:Uncharacterized protein n=1 Tax=Panicum virgatum TaxID=38727 RepID=A0A8T0SE91_PANVG|nr:hypothetical protein PVAP13_5KG205000 [Panicum virgatum]